MIWEQESVSDDAGNVKHLKWQDEQRSSAGIRNVPSHEDDQARIVQLQQHCLSLVTRALQLVQYLCVNEGVNCDLHNAPVSERPLHRWAHCLSVRGGGL